MKESRKRRNKIRKNLIIVKNTEKITHTDEKRIKRLRLKIKDLKSNGNHSKELKRVVKQIIKEQLENTLKEIGTSLKNIEKLTNFPQKELTEFFADFYVNLVFHK